MSGTKDGGKRVNESMLKRFAGDKAALHKWRQEIGAKGGAASNTGGFYRRRDLAKKYGAIGGSISRRVTR